MYNKTITYKQQARELVSKMTLAEKVSQMISALMNVLDIEWIDSIVLRAYLPPQPE